MFLVIQECDWDGGDCCDCTCTPTGTSTCGVFSYDCQDPDANCDLADSSSQTDNDVTTPTSTSDGLSAAVIGGICAACFVVLLAACAGVCYVQARKRRDQASDNASSVQYPVRDPSGGDGRAVDRETGSAQYPVALTAPA